MKCPSANHPKVSPKVGCAVALPKSYWLEVCPRSTSDKFPSWMLNRKWWAIAVWQTILITPFAIYQQSSDMIEPDMNIITCFTCEE